jgi:simple sugar transport system permease protein
MLSGSMHIGFLIGAAIAVVLFLALRSTRWGYEILIIGGNRRAAEYAGIPVTRHIIRTMVLSGAIAGIAGAVEITGTVHRLSMTISMGYGFFGIVVSALSGASMLVMVPISFLLAVLLNGGIVAQTQGLSVNVMVAVNGLIVLFAAIGQVAAQYHFVRHRKTWTTDGEGIPAIVEEDSMI